MLISGNKDKRLRFLKFSGKIISSPPSYFSIENSLFKNIFGHNFCSCQPIFKIFVAHFTTHLVLNIIRKIVCLSLNKAKFPRAMFLWQSWFVIEKYPGVN